VNRIEPKAWRAGGGGEEEEDSDCDDDNNHLPSSVLSCYIFSVTHFHDIQSVLCLSLLYFSPVGAS
jgi:hypothetical protein